jgi:hypothetical protein
VSVVAIRASEALQDEVLLLGEASLERAKDVFTDWELFPCALVCASDRGEGNISKQRCRAGWLSACAAAAAACCASATASRATASRVTDVI